MPGWPEDPALLEGPAPEVASLLLGAVLRTHAPEGTVAVRLTEVEAYAGRDDPGSHAFRGRTARTEVMFGPAGRLYVYFTYGMHHCCNVVVGPDGQAAAVLLRAGEVVEGLELAQSRRPGAAIRDLARGPARLCRALALNRSHDGVDLARGPVRLEVPGTSTRSTGPAPAVCTGPRVGLRQAADRPWRFWYADDPTVSTYRPAPARSRGPTSGPGAPGAPGEPVGRRPAR